MPFPDYNRREWVIEDVEEIKVKALAGELKMPYLPALILWKRGYRDASSVEKFLNPRLEDLFDPFLIPDMDKGIERLLQAKASGEKVLVHGDYDVDGVSATALLVRGFERLGIKAEPYLPHRIREGYGLSVKSIDKAKETGASLILTVDCGTSAIDEASQVEASGLDLIVTDHHEAGEVLPKALAVINPKREDSEYPFPELAGVGVAYKLLKGLYQKAGESAGSEDLDLVAVGTIADVVPLREENRILAWHGLKQLKRTRKPGLKALLEACSAGERITSYNVAFGLAPRLNASGRMGDANQALELLLTEDDALAGSLTHELTELNEVRKKVEAEILDQAIILAERQVNEVNPRVLVCHGQGWHEGVIGIVASRLVERFFRPVVMLASSEGMLKGSARSIPGFHLHDALVATSEFFEDFGGHEAAAGMVMNKIKLKPFIKAINEYAEKIPAEIFLPRLHLDAKIELADINDATRECFERFRPFGEGNPEPLLATFGLEVVGNPRVLGQKHLKFTVRKDSKVAPAVAFGASELILELESGKKDALDLAYRIDEDTYWGKKTLKLIAEEVLVREKKDD
ncbi:single-stranded-DNA-specific exonuclease RecJ [candidate division WOR-3 bacterium]|nr:single-stranded-DNA-specific exonuclease RecJ [candidate division WOR-3 bacterium]